MKIDDFKSKVIGHPLLLQTHRAVIDLVNEPAGKSVAVVMGPTGVGKTTLSDRLKDTSTGLYAKEMAEHAAIIPIVSVEAPSSETGIFNWREFYIRILAEMHDPAVELGIALANGGEHGLRVSRLSTLNLSELRRMVETAFQFRKVKLLLIDEAQHLQKMASGRRLNDQMDALKSLASLANVFVILIGTYDLIRLVELNGQLARRCISVHFPRYRYDHPGELANFKKAINSFGKLLERDGQEHGLLQHTDLLYRGSVGCIGILKNWLTSAFVLAESRNTSPGLPELEGTIQPTSTLMKILMEINEGEDHWRRSFAQNPQLDEMLGMTGKPLTVPQTRKRSVQAVGERKPVRDAIGLEAPFA